MENLIHADIFFFVTTIAVILIALVIIIILIYIAVIMSDIREISKMVRKEGAEIAEDLKDIRTEIRANMRAGWTMASFFKMFRWFSSKRRRSARHEHRKQEDEDEA